MSKKTNKTSHVMDLLTNGASTDSDSPVTEAVSNQEKKSPDVQSHTVTPAKVTVVDEGSRNDRLSQEILGKLTEELEEETKQEADTDPEETIAGQGSDIVETPSDQDPKEASADSLHTDSADAVETESRQGSDSQEEGSEVSPQDAAAALDNSQDSRVLPKTKQHPIIPESQLNSRFSDKEYRFINVMEQLLMRQDLASVLTQYDVCTCPRCMSDVCALVLTGLPSKYVVTSRDSISPLISYYENKYKIPVLTELMKACDKVRQNPRHKVPH